MPLAESKRSVSDVEVKVTPEVRVAAAQTILSGSSVEVSEVLRCHRDEVLVLVKKLLASAEIQVTLQEECSPEQKWFDDFKVRFDALSQLHKGVEWADVERTLEANKDGVKKLRLLDESGFEMNVFGEKDGYIIFRTAQTDVTRINKKFRSIMYDKKAQMDNPQKRSNGNAEALVEELGVELANLELYNKFKVSSGWLWISDNSPWINGSSFRAMGMATYGHRTGDKGTNAHHFSPNGSLCVALRLKKA